MVRLRVISLLALAAGAHAITLADLDRGPAPEVRAYKTVDGVPLKLYWFRAAGERLPAFVWIHGGGWHSGTADSGFPIARYFASRGMAAFSVEYRLVKTGGPFVNDSLEDCKSAIEYIRAHAQELGVDVSRIAVAGDSAGGHLAAAIGGLASAMLIYNGVLDLTEGTWGQYARPGTAAALSPVFQVRPGAPPAIVLHGLNDTVVNPDQSRRFCAAMRQAGNRCDLVLVEGARHAFVMPHYTAPEPVVVKAFRDGDAFLGSLGYLHGTPTLQ